jgi:hypothetical protein
VATIHTKEDLFQDYFYYFIDKPSPLQRCSACRQSVDTKSLYIQTTSVCILGNDVEIVLEIPYNLVLDDNLHTGHSVAVRLVFCLNDICLANFLNYPKRQIKNHAPFHNILWVYEKDQEEARSKLSKSNWMLEVLPPLNEL